MELSTLYLLIGAWYCEGVDVIPERHALLRGAVCFLRRDRTMFGKNPAADKALQKLVDRRLQQSGGSQLGLKAVVVNGCAT